MSAVSAYKADRAVERGFAGAKRGVPKGVIRIHIQNLDIKRLPTKKLFVSKLKSKRPLNPVNLSTDLSIDILLGGSHYIKLHNCMLQNLHNLIFDYRHM